jgi:post-segregation antitoxin (ccd killing protein)
MAQRIIVIHGRSTKPAKAPHQLLLKKALIQGVTRSDPAKAQAISRGDIPVDFVYYGDVNNALLAESPAHRKKMTETDPEFGHAPCVPHDEIEPAIDTLAGISRFTKADYRKVIRNNADLRWMDDAARAISTLAAITTGTFLNEKVISHATRDMGAYLLTRKIGSKVRSRLQTPLKSALMNGDDICLISHSMGCMVSYDVLWKFSRMSEYADVQAGRPKVNLWLTLGCPLGEAGVKNNLYDGNERNRDKYPQNIIKDWVNIAARDDFIAHDSTMKGDYRKR